MGRSANAFKPSSYKFNYFVIRAKSYQWLQQHCDSEVSTGKEVPMEEPESGETQNERK